MFYLKDDNGVKSMTTTLVWVGIATASLKLLLAGTTLYGITFGDFSGSDYALVVAPFLALLAHKRQVKARSTDQTEASASLQTKQKGD